MDNKHFISQWVRAASISLLLCLMVGMASAQQRNASYTNPALAGDYPDPSVIRVGQDYWATATSSEWAPEFPLMRSRDLVNWDVVGAVFQRRPEWSNGNYWAPEISQWRGRFYVYYVGHKKDGPLCVAVATAPRPGGPYTDHGPMVCQEAGSIDAMPVTDERNQRYLVWKEDGNSRSQPTPIWAQQLTTDGTKLVGERKELIRNDASWEAQLVEGPFIMRRSGWFYMFYSGNACCGLECNYAMGVARSRKLLGPWEKNPANPILKGNDLWKCPGHGSIVAGPERRDFLLYHAYHPKDFVYVGRQALLDEVNWGANGWPTINEGKGPRGRGLSAFGARERNSEYAFIDDFTATRLRPGWQWPQANEPSIRLEPGGGGWLILSPRSAQEAGNPVAAVVAQSTTVGDYTATTTVDTSSLTSGALAGLAAYGNAENALGASIGGGKVLLWRREKNEHRVLTTIDAPPSRTAQLRMTARDGHRFRFAVSGDGRSWKDVGGELEGSHLPPWDLGVRVALTSGGASSASARFGSLRITPSR